MKMSKRVGQPMEKIKFEEFPCNCHWIIFLPANKYQLFDK